MIVLYIFQIISLYLQITILSLLSLLDQYVSRKRNIVYFRTILTTLFFLIPFTNIFKLFLILITKKENFDLIYYLGLH